MKKSFVTVFYEYDRRMKHMSRRYSQQSSIHYEQFYSVLSECLWDSYNKFDPSAGVDFNTYVYKAFGSRVTNLIKSKENRDWNRVRFLENNSTGSDRIRHEELPDFVDENEHHRIENNLYKKKEAQQRQLLNFLLESTKIQNDPTMTAIIEGLPRYNSVMALAKALGLQRNTVDRKLRRLARYYDPEIHGDILDYFPDGVRVKREFLTA